ncbi:MAG TPA: hypothetical protein VFL83_21505 [Anaeromyxobacter sp.]|nr:hypothetical protein [Anaeromyxobacter sp.]
MFLVRAAAFVQVTFLPGYVLLVALGIDRSHRIQTLVRAFAASLVVNWVLVFVLTVTRLYHPTVLWLVFALECAWFVRLHWRRRASGDLLGIARLEPLRETPLPFQVALMLAVASAVVLGAYVLWNSDAVFTEWDAVASWNRWALDWAANRLPVNAQHYPQLVPASWSVLYVLSNDTVVQAQARMVQALYPLAIALTFIDVGLRHRSSRVLLAAPIWTILMHLIAAPWNAIPDVLSSGWVDIPVSFFGLLAVVTALYAEERTERDWLLALFFACGAALTKQAGLFALAFVWAYALVERRDRKFVLSSAALVVVLVASWYVMKQIQIQLGLDGSEIPYVTGGVHQGRGPLERVLYAGVLLGRIPYLGPLGIPALVAAAALVGIAARDARHRIIVLGLVLPFLAVWLFLYSYDTRNATLVVPLVALAMCHALPSREITRIPTRLELVAAAGVAVAAWGAVTYVEDEARERQLAQQRRIGDPEVNAALYQFFEANPIRGRVLTAYQMLGFLPGFKDRMVALPGVLRVAELDAADGDPEIGYLLHPVGWMSPTARQAIDERVAAGRYRHVFFARSRQGLGVLRFVQLRP